MIKGKIPDGYKDPNKKRSSGSKPKTLDIVRIRSIDIENNDEGNNISSYQNSEGGKCHNGSNRAVIPFIYRF